MHFTYVVRPSDVPAGRGPSCDTATETPLNYFLRIGSLLQLTAYIGLVALIRLSTEKCCVLLTFLKVTPEAVGSAPVGLVVLLLGLSLAGLVCQLAFVTIADDDGSIKQSRGFRAGTKLFSQGNSMAAISTILTLMSFYAANRYFTDAWMGRELGSETNWLLYCSGRMADCIALLLLSSAIFFVEAYHSEGTSEIWGWVIAMLYRIAAISEFLYLVMEDTRYEGVADAIYTISLGLALMTSTVWAFLFEPVTHRYDVTLRQSAMRAEYYKSRNAMAYYGPAVVDANGELDMQQSGIFPDRT